jgi:type IV secretion system protein VirD4
MRKALIVTGTVAAAAGAVLPHDYGYPIGLAGAALTTGALGVYSRSARGRGSRAIRRWDRNTRRHGGTASRWQIFRTSSRLAMYRRAAVLRPSLAELGWWRRLDVSPLTYATPLCRVGRRTVWTSCEESTLRVGIPGTGKTAELACRVIDAPGGAVVASTAADLYELTHALRKGPVTVFNPGGIGGLESTLHWSVLDGCADPQTAARRAADLIGPDGNDEAARWNVHARGVLTVFLHAAAIGGYRMRDVQRWVANPDAAARQILTALLDSPNAAEMGQAAEQALRMTTRTRDGVMLAVAPAVAWVTQPAAAECGDADPDEVSIVDDLVDRAGTLYLLGDEDGAVGPLVAALTSEIVYQARAIAARRPGGRLDPGLALILDEVALICPTPLDRWMSELRKRSIVAHAACQGLAQLRERWGKDGASMILNAAAAVLVFGGCKDPEDLAAFTALAGEREEVADTHDAHGRRTSSTTRRVPVISTAMLAGLPNHRAMLIRRGMPVALATTPIAWKRRDVRAMSKARVRVAVPA